MKELWNVLTDEEKEFAPHWAMVLFGGPMILIAACMLAEWLESLV